MTHSTKPKIGLWYKNEAGDSFEVVAWDEGEKNIEIQHFDGSIEELDLDVWSEYGIVAIEAPEDWSGSYDIQREDYGVDLEISSPISRNPLEEFEQ